VVSMAFSFDVMLLLSGSRTTFSVSPLSSQMRVAVAGLEDEAKAALGEMRPRTSSRGIARSANEIFFLLSLRGAERLAVMAFPFP